MKKSKLITITNLLLLTFTFMACKHSTNNPTSEESKTPGTTKSPQAPETPQSPETQTPTPIEYKVGDIILKDGYISASDFAAKEETEQNAIKENAIAVIYVAGTEGSALGVGLNQIDSLQWAVEKIDEEDFIARNVKFERILSNPGDGTEIAALDFSNPDFDNDGSNNWQEIVNFFESYEASDPSSWDNTKKEQAQNIENYPAFYNAINYATIQELNCEKYKDGWYLPSAYEIVELLLTLDAIFPTLKELGTTFSTANKTFWTSNQADDEYNVPYILFSDPNWKVYLNDKAYKHSICVIRKF